MEIEMKRFIVCVLLLLLVSWIMARHREARRLLPAPPGEWSAPRRHFGNHDNPRVVGTARRQIERAWAGARQADAQASDAVRHSDDRVHDENHPAAEDLRVSFAGADGRDRPEPWPMRRESAEGLPVPIVPGTRVTEALPQQPVSDLLAVLPTEPVKPSASGTSRISDVAGDISATPARATAEASRALRLAVVKWLDPDVPSSWSCPQRLLDAMILDTRIEPHVKDYGTLYVAALTVDSSPSRRALLVEAYNRELVVRRMFTLGGTLVFVLVCLAALSGYIRADEATKGYYTNRLRALTAAGVLGAGVIIYRMIV
jgi:hypothetical protein